jgi:hypothetical protein
VPVGDEKKIYILFHFIFNRSCSIYYYYYHYHYYYYYYYYQGMLDEADGPMNFTQMVTLFASKMAGGTDDDETILKSFEVRSMQILSP